MTIYYLIMSTDWFDGDIHVHVDAGPVDGSQEPNHFELIFDNASEAATDLKSALMSAASTQFGSAVTTAINAAEW